MRAMKAWTYLIGALPVCVIVGSFAFRDKQAPPDPKKLYEQYCGNCHKVPSPSDLTKQVWQYNVLPVMGGRLGIVYRNFDQFKGLKKAEIEVLQQNHYFPEKPLITQENWDIVVNYILQHAPDSIPLDSSRLHRNTDLTQFVRQDIRLYDKPGSMITGLEFNPATHTLWIGDLNKTVVTWQWDKGINEVINVESPVVDFDFHGDSTYFTQIGSLFPTELSTGSFIMSSGTKKTGLLDSLHRPVHGEICDLDNDGVPEIIVANFGNKIGSLSLYKKNKATGRYMEQVLLPMPGAIKFYVQDMNGDGKKDIVAIFAQGDESIYIFYQKENLQFSPEKVLSFPPDYGSSDFVLVDYDHDGHLDIVTVNGDNADYSDILKKFHGMRLHLNDGHGKFTEKFFYPLYGATKILADDFDQDGDIDFAITAFFPDFGVLRDESFVYLENTNSAKFHFKSYTLKDRVPVKSLTMEKADIDGDGDMDIVLGMFSHSPGPVPTSLQQKWDTSNYDLTVFINQLHKPAVNK